MVIKYVLFDNDGTLYRHNPRLFHDLRKRMIKYLAKLLGKSEKEVALERQQLFKKYKIDSTAFVFGKEYGIDRNLFLRETFLKMPLAKYGIRKDRRLYNVLKSINLPKSIITNNHSEFARNVLRTLGVEELFENVIGSQEMGFKHKPAKEAFAKALKIAGYEPSETLFIDDIPEFHREAEKLGITTVLLDSESSKNPRQKRKYHDHVISEIYEIGKIIDKINSQNVIIDTDPGHDDAMAIMLALKSNIFKVHAITTVAGNSTIENTTRNARFILKLLQREDIPVYSGEKKPLKRELVKAVVHGKSGLEGIDPKNSPGLTGDAVKQIISIVRKNPGKITLIALGPLTNVAKAIKRNPGAMKKLKSIVIMGGAINVPGNKSKVAEFNMFVDPEAADIVMRFPVKKAMVPLDACNHVVMQRSDFAKISNPDIRKPVLKMIKPYIANTLKEEGVNGALMYDPLTVYYLINQKACKTKELNIRVETKIDSRKGMTIANRKKGKCETSNVIVVERISAKNFKKDFIECLSI